MFQTKVFRVGVRIALILGIVLAVRHASTWLADQLPQAVTTGQSMLIAATLVVYVVLLMIPFVPGVEIGLGLMMALGPGLAPWVYGSTVLALCLAFLVGRCVPQDRIIRVLDRWSLDRMAALLRRLQPLDTDARLDLILQRARFRGLPFLLRYRLVALVVALNLPGNVVLGGGGGICMMAGFCRLFSLPGFLGAVSLAVAPIPVAIFFLG